jgi:hypothetical protein
VGEVGGWVLVAVGRNKQKMNAWCNIQLNNNIVFTMPCHVCGLWAYVPAGALAALYPMWIWTDAHGYIFFDCLVCWRKYLRRLECIAWSRAVARCGG